MTLLVALTPAHNEAPHLEALAKSIAAQTVTPDVWVIVDDRSTDGTGDIADNLAESYDFIHVIHRDHSSGRRLSSKAEAVTVAYDAALRLCPEAEFVASIDADVELPPQCFELLLDRFAEEPKLGVTGGVYRHPVKGELREGRISATHVPGPLQVFRRSVFDAIGGYQPMPDGGLDVVSTAHARMLGWETRVHPDLVISHNRRVGTGGDRHPLAASFHSGQRDYSLGSSLPFALVKSVNRIGDAPIFLAALAQLLGHLSATVTRRPRGAPPEIQAFIRAEQSERILDLLPGRRARR